MLICMYVNSFKCPVTLHCILDLFNHPPGAHFIEGVQVLSVHGELTDSLSSVTPRVSRVESNLGSVSCEYFVNAAGMVGGGGVMIFFLLLKETAISNSAA